MAREADIHGFTCSKLTIKAGGTSGMLLDVTRRNVWTQIKNFSGGSLELIGVPPGITYTGTSLSSLQGTGYLFGAAEVVSFYGPARYYLMATTADAVCYVALGLSSPGGPPIEGGL